MAPFWTKNNPIELSEIIEMIDGLVVKADLREDTKAELLKFRDLATQQKLHAQDTKYVRKLHERLVRGSPMPERELELVFYPSCEISREMHDVVQVAAHPYLNEILGASEGLPSSNQVLTLWAMAVSPISILYGRMGLATAEEVHQFSNDEGSLLILQIMGIGRNANLSEARKVELFDQAYLVFAKLLEHIDAYSNRAIDLALEGRPPSAALMDFFKTSPVHSPANYGSDAPLSIEQFALILLGVFMDTLTAGLNQIAAKRGEN